VRIADPRRAAKGRQRISERKNIPYNMRCSTAR
jgi:hypothetical protein